MTVQLSRHLSILSGRRQASGGKENAKVQCTFGGTPTDHQAGILCQSCPDLESVSSTLAVAAADAPPHGRCKAVRCCRGTVADTVPGGNHFTFSYSCLAHWSVININTRHIKTTTASTCLL